MGNRKKNPNPLFLAFIFYSLIWRSLGEFEEYIPVDSLELIDSWVWNKEKVNLSLTGRLLLTEG
jgi:hypothetical protein